MLIDACTFSCIAVKSELLGSTTDGNVGATDSPFVSDALAAAGDYQSAYAASYYSRYTTPIAIGLIPLIPLF